MMPIDCELSEMKLDVRDGRMWSARDGSPRIFHGSESRELVGVTMLDQYPPGTGRGDMPDEIVDPEGDTWVWTNADKMGIPGYQFAGGGMCPRSKVSVGPAHTREYVKQAGYCSGNCDHLHHRQASSQARGACLTKEIE